MVIKNVRCDWVFLAETNQHGGYSMCIMLSDKHPQLADVKAMVEKAKVAGVAKGLFTEANTKSANFKNVLHNGSEEVLSEERPKHYDGHWYINANNKSLPGIVGPDSNPLMDNSCLYSGAFYHVDINVYPFNNKSKGIGCAVNNVMFVRDGDRLDGRQSAEDAFAGLETNEGDLQ